MSYNSIYCTPNLFYPHLCLFHQWLPTAGRGTSQSEAGALCSETLYPDCGSDSNSTWLLHPDGGRTDSVCPSRGQGSPPQGQEGPWPSPSGRGSSKHTGLKWKWTSLVKTCIQYWQYSIFFKVPKEFCPSFFPEMFKTHKYFMSLKRYFLQSKKIDGNEYEWNPWLINTNICAHKWIFTL